MFQQFGERARLVPVIGVTLGLALPAAAQQPTPKVEVSLGYVVVRDQDIYRETFPLGWNVEVATRWTRRLNIVGEVGGAYRNLDLLGTRFDLNVHTFMAGLRLSGWHEDPRKETCRGDADDSPPRRAQDTHHRSLSLAGRWGFGSALRGSFSSRMAALYAKTAATAACWITSSLWMRS